MMEWKTQGMWLRTDWDQIGRNKVSIKLAADGTPLPTIWEFEVETRSRLNMEVAADEMALPTN